MKSLVVDIRPKQMMYKLKSPSIKPMLVAAVLIEFSIIIVYSKMGNQYVQVASMDFSKLDKAGNNILTTLQRIGYWIVLGSSGVEIIKCALAKDLHAIWKVIGLAIVLYGSFFALPYFLKLVENIF